ncbi:MAG: nucleoside triphosphate pyrophosphohydrolase [Candidatus Cryptobacteroides sp.]|nr:nucleoside triphosphate pyrophosphohydrolase [Bacteroidales bacterium]MCI7635152.1 nucleoside triphosphate pyrophosphohydrolase [Bacteroidales bacterium]MDY3227473.1 nucleoside triphosphate pyrophosphohydrolase [Candidatus Cryptobacteroides sp.]MDY4571870.1 nucleoside triphosphate pyrophosphohydrolase [Candidatus Cryptobacteroides sp.]MDY6183468.1 nucleoside triphosphate pyrophosphohydrolase [Candidatus Cryptobacteroides sp.]
MAHTNEEKLSQFGRVLDVMCKLREKCPWNAAQTMESLRPMTLEEAYELSDAILKKSESDIEKELGDVLLHVVFYSRIAEERGEFDIADVMDRLCEKMIFRHPHVFSDTKVADAQEVSENWEMLKTKEKGGNKRILSGVPDSLPPILKALAMQDKARGVGFDWECPSQVWDKVKEEQVEFQDELEAMAEEEKGIDVNVNEAPLPGSARDRAEEELGDFMFAVINAARLYGLNPDTALNRACDKFRRRFTYLEENTIRKGRNLTDMTLAEMDAIWDEGKAKGL